MKYWESETTDNMYAALHYSKYLKTHVIRSDMGTNAELSIGQSLPVPAKSILLSILFQIEEFNT